MTVLYDSQKEGFISDLRQCLSMQTAWVNLSFHDIRSKYRRTHLGPWWMVIGMTITLGMMSTLWSVIFGLDWRQYLPYMITGIVTWYWLSAYILGACDLFAAEFSGLIKAMPVSPLVYILRFVIRGFILHLHYMLIPLMTMVITGTAPSWSLLFWFPVSSALILMNAAFISVYLGFLCARVRDISQLIKSILPAILLLTPAIWHPSMLGNYVILAELNPFTHFLEIVRAPLLGGSVDWLSIMVVLAVTVINFCIAAVVYKRYRRYLVFWI